MSICSRKLVAQKPIPEVCPSLCYSNHKYGVGDSEFPIGWNGNLNRLVHSCASFLGPDHAAQLLTLSSIVCRVIA
jgi:hypothetical protein